MISDFIREYLYFTKTTEINIFWKRSSSSVANMVVLFVFLKNKVSYIIVP